jgi:hypothetical protein
MSKTNTTNVKKYTPKQLADTILQQHPERDGVFILKNYEYAADELHVKPEVICD